METPRSVAERLLAGNHEAFDQFYEMYFGRIYLYAQRRTASESAARALCREIFEVVLERLPRFGGGVDLDVWVLRIAKEVTERHARSAETGRAAAPVYALVGE